MGFLGSIGKAVGAIPGMKTMNKALPGGGMPGVNQPKPQLGGGLGPSIMQKQMPNLQPMPMPPQNNAPQSPPIAAQGPPMQKQFTMPQFQPQPWMQNPNIPHNTGFAGSMRGGGMMGPSPDMMAHLMNRGGGQMNFPMNRGQSIQAPMNTGFARPSYGAPNNPNIQY